MVEMNLVNERYDQSKAMAIRIDTTCLKWDLKRNAVKTKAYVHPKSLRKWGFFCWQDNRTGHMFHISRWVPYLEPLTLN